jgi:nucleoside-triphosphatase
MTQRSILVSGVPGVGKSSCLERVADACKDMVVDGVISAEIRRDGKRCGFGMRLISSGSCGILASPDIDSTIRFGTLNPDSGEPRLGVTHDFLKNTVCSHLRGIIGEADLIVVDEIGSMQATCDEFIDVVNELIAAGTPLLASISLADDPWIQALRSRGDIPVLELTKSNRDLTTEMLTSYVREWVNIAHSLR